MLCTTAALVAAAVVGAVAQTAPVQRGSAPNALLIDSQLQARGISLSSIDSRGVTVVDSSGQRTSIPHSAVSAVVSGLGGADATQGIGASPARSIVPIERLKPRMESRLVGALRTVDGQRFPGDLAPTAGPRDTVLWQHPKLGQITFPLDKVAALVRSGYADTVPSIDNDAAPVQDELILVNGDRLEGLIVDLGDPVRLEGDDKKVVELSADRVSAAILSNPRARAGGTMIWLDDGTIASAKRLESTNPDRITLTLTSDQSAEYELSTVRAVAFDFARLLPLSSLTPVSQTPVGDRLRVRPIVRVHHSSDVGVGPAVTLNAWDIEFPGPMKVEYMLPDGVKRLAATVALAEHATPWGDCEVIVTQSGTELWRERLNADTPSYALNVPVEAGTLTITLDPGAYGPINDRAVFRRPLLLLK